MTKLEWFHFGANTLLIVWHAAYLVRSVLRLLGRQVPPWASVVFFEFRPLVPFAIAAMFVSGVLAWTGGANHAAVAFNAALFSFNWWLSRREKDDDDRWRRRREAALSKVAEVGGRLQVVPAGGAQ